MIKKWVLLITLCTVLIWAPLIAKAYGHGHGGDDFLPGLCIGGALGAGLGCLAAEHAQPPPPPPPPPRMCYREVPGHWEERWNEYHRYYEKVWVPPFTESIPCP